MATIAASGDRVAVLTENRPEFVECYYGVPRPAWAVPQLPAQPLELVRIINNAKPTVLITESGYLEAVNGIRGELPSVDTVVLAGGKAIRRPRV
jgi:acyl-CoA synthetase (AMP-forming)/AMP-acid ligase II